MDSFYLYLISFLWFFHLNMPMSYDYVIICVLLYIISTFVFIIIKIIFFVTVNKIFILRWRDINFILYVVTQLILFIKSSISILNTFNIICFVICTFCTLNFSGMPLFCLNVSTKIIQYSRMNLTFIIMERLIIFISQWIRKSS